MGNEAPIELIGWLYQYYNSEKKDEVFEGLKKKSKNNKRKYSSSNTIIYTRLDSKIYGGKFIRKIRVRVYWNK